MKIFNWVHRRFIPRDGLGQNHVKKHEEIPLANSNDDHAEDTAALLLDNDDDEMLQLFQGHNYGSWGGAGAGILSIGTFGLDKTLGINIHPPEANKEYFGPRAKDADQELESEDEDQQRSEEESDHHDDAERDDDESEESDSDCEEEWNPLVYDKSGASRPTNASSAVIIGNSIHNGAKPVRPSNLQLQPDYSDQEHVHSNYSSYRRIMINTTKKEKERITLADLFSADSDDAIWIDGTAKNNVPSCNFLQARCIKNKAASATPHPPDRAPKNGTLLFPKKLIPLVKQDSRPIQKLQGLMKRMLKRKIHPDVVAAGKNNATAAGNGIPSENRQFGINESVSLLQSQGKFCADKNI